MTGEVVICLPAADAGRLRDACDAGYLLDAAARVFGLLRSGLAGGFLSLDDEAAILGLAELAERALDHAARAEGDELARLSVALDAAMGGPGDDTPETGEDAP